jgi:hypothetical protein
MPKAPSKREIKDMDNALSHARSVLDQVLARADGPQPKLRVVGQKKAVKTKRK